ncbi:hypothetical protein MLD38_039817 [Melastoma candidum]|uniref:Uncharacterized protein n=1 Tax=Melastoma candidum TaxID=119954 RepID=A0ACB9L426_9MYRT|nr:hypothetical protein MLD38_039817 [Melastoma candidum]
MSSSRVIFALSLSLLVLTSLSLVEPQEPDVSDELFELMALQSRSPSGIIRLDDDSVSRFLTSVPTPRPYSLVISFDLAKLHSGPNPHLSIMQYEYSLLAKSFLSNQNENVSQRLFFCILEFSESNSSFALFGVGSLPHLRVILPYVTSMDKSGYLNLPDDILWRAEHMAELIESATGIIVGQITRPPRYSRIQIAVATAITLITVPSVVKKIVRGETFLHRKEAWLVGAVSVYFFSVSGLMFNVIRKMPMFIVDKKDASRVIYFVPGMGRQLGVEGIAVGLLYALVGLMLAGITHGAVKVDNGMARQGVMVVAMAASAWAVGKVVKLDNWKTGYRVHMYLPSRWR